MLDVYGANEKRDMFAAIDDLCSPNDSIGWASTGLYCYWSVPEHEILYIGRAVDLASRFGQHNGFIPCPPEGCKSERINEYFADNNLLGYSMVVQNPLAQAKSHRAVRRFRGDPFATADLAELGAHGLDSSKEVEGRLIAAYRRVHGRFPPWNAISGATKSRASQSPARTPCPATEPAEPRPSMVTRHCRCPCPRLVPRSASSPPTRSSPDRERSESRFAILTSRGRHANGPDRPPDRRAAPGPKDAPRLRDLTFRQRNRHRTESPSEG